MDIFPNTIIKIFSQAIFNRAVSVADRYHLMAALLDRELLEAELQAVDQLVHTIQPR
ncbi:MAG: hypothetical protein F6J87_17360 [Spirulina sp. SIO3F2]|nr:hypothetical protein [Spirulina sp. SIO3F2]